jgi:hypothetical protein
MEVFGVNDSRLVRQKVDIQEEGGDEWDKK